MIAEGLSARNLNSYMPHTARHFSATGDMIEVQMCTLRAVPTGNERDTDIAWALGAVKSDTGERYNVQRRHKTFVSTRLLSHSYFNFVGSSRTSSLVYAKMSMSLRKH
jgi:hypothetical protein